MTEVINVLENENMKRRRIFKYSKFHYFFLSYEHIILLLVNFILAKKLHVLYKCTFIFRKREYTYLYI